ncbi:MAG TPA: PAS domain-containing protein, partial [Chthoniobacterales bacterium]|nr:PAS domain-containing protein [Chthoniobacterales bacterium]
RLTESFETGAPTEEEWRVVWPDGSTHWLVGRWLVLKNPAGKPVRVRGVNIDITDRKRIEQTVRESEERFRNIADTAPVMIWVADRDNLGTFFNKAWLDFTGRSMEQESGEGWIDSVHPDDLEHCLSICGGSFTARRAFQIVFRLRRADGEYRWVLDNGTPRHRDGEFLGYIGSCVDITDQKRVEEDLRSSHAQLKDSQRLANVGSWELDIAARTTRWSDEWYRIFELPRNVPGDLETFLSRVHPNDRAIVIEAETRALSARAPFVVDFRIVRPSGEVRSVRAIVEAIRNGEGELVRLAGAVQDITEQIKATELLRASEKRLKTAERMTHVGHWAWDLKTNQASWSEEIFRIMGQPEDHEPRYETFLDTVQPGDRDRLKNWAEECIREKRGSVIEYRVARPNGDVRTVVCMSEVLLDDEGSPECLFGACQDVTDARRAQEESFARQKLESLGTLSGGIAHDFNNLLGAVLAQTELAMAELASGSRADEQLNAIRDLSIRGSEIVRQLMIYAGKERDVPMPADVSDVVKGMLGLLKVAISRHATLATNLAEDLPAVQARSAQLSQIVMNLVVNASEALGDREGVIRVTADHKTIGVSEAEEKGLPIGDYVRLEVSDTGCGMTPDTQAKVFDPFFTTKFSGRGLGLAVVHGIVRSLRASIQVASEPGRGATFEVLLPCAETGRNPAEAAASPIEDSVPPRRAAILFVEDEEQLRLPVAKMLRSAGLAVFEAANGSDAIDLLHARGADIDLVLLDLTIPGSSSQEVVAETSQASPYVKVILTSAYSEEVAKSMIDSPLVSGFIRKPFRLGDLVQTVRGVLNASLTRSAPG